MAEQLMEMVGDRDAVYTESEFTGTMLDKVNKFLAENTQWHIVSSYSRTRVFYTGRDEDIRQEECEVVYLLARDVGARE